MSENTWAWLMFGGFAFLLTIFLKMNPDFRKSIRGDDQVNGGEVPIEKKD